MMTRHRIVGSEADQAKPLAYVSIYPRRGREMGRYIAAALIGALLMLAAAIAWAAISGVITSA